jgi:hypothetical protein
MCDWCGKGSHKQVHDHIWNKKRRHIRPIEMKDADVDTRDLDRQIRESNLAIERFVNVANSNRTWEMEMVMKNIAPGFRSSTVHHLSNGTLAKKSYEIWKIMATKKAFSSTLKASALTHGVVAVLKTAYHVYKWWNKKLSGEELFRSITRTMVGAAGGIAGATAGYYVGGAIGSIFGPGGIILGTYVGGVLGGVGGQQKAEEFFDEHIWQNTEQKKRERQLRDALELFDYTARDIDNSHYFNERELRKRFRKLCRTAHPDRNGGSIDIFEDLTKKLGILLALLNKDYSTKKDTAEILRSLR